MADKDQNNKGTASGAVMLASSGVKKAQDLLELAQHLISGVGGNDDGNTNLPIVLTGKRVLFAPFNCTILLYS